MDSKSGQIDKPKPPPGEGSSRPEGPGSNETGKEPKKDELRKIGKYELQKKIGAGGMGTVYLALDTQLKRTVALKLLPREKAQNPTLVRRFQAEAQSAAALRHDNIVTVYEAGEAGGYYFMALEFIDGTDADNLVQKRGLVPVKRSIEIIKQVARALQHAHNAGIVHRDIKPANLLIRRDGVVKLADLGLARSLDEAADTGITRAGTTVGTVDYMSPEQGRDSKAADVRSDIYSLGCTWYHLITGEPPFPHGSMTNKLRDHAVTPPPDPRSKNAKIPEGVVAIIHRMMAKDPKQRYQTPDELLEDLQNAHIGRDTVSQSTLSELARDEAGLPETAPSAPADSEEISLQALRREIARREAQPAGDDAADDVPARGRKREKPRPEPSAANDDSADEVPTPGRRREKARRESAPADDDSSDEVPTGRKRDAPRREPAPAEDDSADTPARERRREKPRREPARDDADSSDDAPAPGRRRDAPRRETASADDETSSSVTHDRRRDLPRRQEASPADDSSEVPVASGPVHRPKPPPPREVRQRDTDSESGLPRDFTPLRNGLVALLLVAAVAGLGWWIWSLDWSGGGGKKSNVNPFAQQVNPATGIPEQPQPVSPQANVQQPIATPAQQPGAAIRGKSDDGAAGANAGASNVPILPLTAESSLPGVEAGAVSADVLAERDRRERKELPAWVSEPRPEPPARVLRVRIDTTDPAEFTTLSAALAAVPADGAAITLVGPGPFPLRPAQIAGRVRIVIQARPESAGALPPLIVMLPQEGGVANSVVQLSGTALELRGVHVALDAAQFKASPRVALFEVTAGDVFIRGCSFSVTGTPADECTVLKLTGTAPAAGQPAGPRHVLVENTLFRGQRLAALQTELEQADLVIRNSLLWSGLAPAVRLEGIAAAAAASPPAETGRRIYFTSSTLCSQRVALQTGGDPQKPIATAVHFLNSLVAAPSGSDAPTLLALQGWTRTQARTTLGKALAWLPAHSMFLGWKNLLQASSDGFVVESFDEWKPLWKDAAAGENVQYQSSSWPQEAGTDIARLSFGALVPQTIGKQHVSANDGGWPGCPLGLLSAVSIESLDEVAHRAVRPPFPPGLLDASAVPPSRTLRVDLAKGADFGKYLTDQKLTDGTLVIVTGQGTRVSSPLVIQDAWVRIRFEQAEGQPLVLTPRFVESDRATTGKRDDAFITVLHGGLELSNGAFTIPALEKQPVPRWMIQVVDGDIALRQCRLQGPMVVGTRNKGLIQWLSTGKPRPKRPFAGNAEDYAAIVDSYLLGAGVLIEADVRRRNLFFRNSVAVARDDLFDLRIPGNDSRIAAAVDLERSTFSAAGTFFKITAGELGAPANAPLQFFADRCVFAPPAKSGAQKPTPTLLTFTGALFEQKQAAWRENRCGYARDIVSFVRPASEAPPAPPATPQPFAQWVERWGADQVIQPLAAATDVMLKQELPSDRTRLEPPDFELHSTSKAATWSNGTDPIGANVATLNLPGLKRTPNPAPAAPKKPAKPGVPNPGF